MEADCSSPLTGDELIGHDPGSSIPPGATGVVTDWWGVIKSTEPGAQFDDCFERQDLEQVIYFGIDSIDPTVRSQIGNSKHRNQHQIEIMYPGKYTIQSRLITK